MSTHRARSANPNWLKAAKEEICRNLSDYSYILEGKDIKHVGFAEWGRWFVTADRHIGDDIIGDVHVSTVFLGIDHAFGIGEPLLFETMIFGGDYDDYQERYRTYEEAEAGHKRAVALVQRES